ncbi:MAG: AAA+ family ATPase, partial [Tepidisphaeraceae bacterium]
SSLEEFQRTRGVLRLMSQVIYTLWSRNDRSLMVLPGLVPIDEPAVESELTRYLTSNWPVIIEKDVDGQHSVPARIDAEAPRFGQVWATRRVARTIYMGSAPVAGTANKGLDLRHVRLGCVQPGENIAVFGDALKQLGDHASHLYADGARYWYSTQPNVTTTARDRAARKTEDDVLFEVSRRLREEQSTRGGFAKIYPAPEGSGDVPDEVDCRLVLLPPDKTHSHGEADSPAMLAAADMLGKRGSSARLYQNTLLFLAADKTRLTELKSAVALFLSWKSIYDEREGLGLDPFNAKLAEKRQIESDRTVAARIPESYQWLLVPEQPDPLKQVEWQALRLTGGDALALRASKRLERDGLMWTSLAGAVLRTSLDKLLWTDADHIGVRKLKEYFPQYVYLPRLSRADLILEGIRDGLASTVWASDTFAYASSFDSANSRYVGLQAGRIGIVVTDDPNSVVVKPSVAQKQLAAERPPAMPGQPAAPAAAGGDSTAPPPGEESRPSTKPPVPQPTPLPKRFFGTVIVDAQRINRDIGTLAAEISHHLAKLPNAEVQVTVEIQADAPAGVPDDVVRTVSENCRTLKFINHGFEKE